MQIPNLIFFLLLLISFCSAPSNSTTIPAKADVGVILDLETPLGKIIKTCISMSIEDFYVKHENSSTMIVPHFRDSKSDIVAATSSAVDLLKNTQVMAIFGPQRSTQADFVIDIGNKVSVPIISPATSPAISPEESPYFIRSAWSCSSQAKAIAAIVKAFGWKEVTFIYQKSKFGSGLLQFLFDGLIQVSHQTVLCSCPGDDQIRKELYQLQTMQTRVFVVHMESKLASRFFRKAKELGMMSKGYAWIIVDSLTSLYSMDSEAVEAMQGVIGLKAYIPSTNELKNFEKRWSKRFLKDNPDMELMGSNAYGLWAYDSMTALAEAVELVGVTSTRFKKRVDGGNLTDLDAIGTSSIGESLVPLIRNYTTRGLSGNFNLINGELQPSAFEIVNVIGRGEHTVGFWTDRNGLSKTLKPDDDGVYSTKRENLGAIIWPGKTSEVPKGWEIPTSGKKLRVGVPMRAGFPDFVKVQRDPQTNATRISGYYIDLFDSVMDALPYAVRYEYVPFDMMDSYDNLSYKVFDGTFDAAVGDITITARRSQYVDFSLPIEDGGITRLQDIKYEDPNKGNFFLKPFSRGLWLTVIALLIFTGLTLWIIEHRLNEDFRGPPSEHRWDSTKARLSEYLLDDALSKGSKNGGIKAMLVTTPYTKLFLSRSKYCKKYMRVGTPDLSEGSAFVFPEGSPLVADISRAIIELMDNGRISEIKGRWISDSCSEDGVQPSHYADQSTIKLESFKILFAVTGGITATCLVVYLASYLYKNRGFVQRISSSGATTRAKIRAMCKHFDQRDPKSFRVSRRGNGDGDQTVPPSPNVYQDRWSSIVPISTDETPVEIRVVCPNSDNSNVAADENL
ncbi:hypothetical protein ACS0TY_036368 [Phlomoides rotata]